jgi:plastocyanin
MNKVILSFCFFIFNLPLYAADIFGKLDVLNKTGSKSRSIASNGIIYLTGVTTATPQQHPKLVQKNKQFSPRVLTIIKGQTIDFWNHDKVQHNVFSTEPKNRFDLGRYSKQKYKSIKYDELGTYKVYCNIHQKMIADIVVLENKYFSKTNASGHYRIKDIPPGKYQLHAWHIFGGQSSQEITIEQTDINLPLQVTSTKIIRDITKHKNKFGRQYSSKKDVLGDLYGNSDNF